MMMKRTHSKVVSLSVSALCCVGLVCGCEDQQAKQTHDDAEHIVNARVEYLNAVTSDNKVSGLQALASGLPNAAANPASGLMSAIANLEIAEQILLESRRIEDENRALRSVVEGLAAAATKLDSLADAHDRFDDQPVQAVITASTRNADSGLASVTAAIDDLEAPIGQLETLNSADREEVAQLRVESRQLREQAFVAGDAGGHQLIELAVKTDKQADTIESEIAQREIELIGLRSELGVAQLQRDLFSKQKSAMSTTSRETSQTIDQFNTISSDVRATLGAYGREVDEALQAIASNMQALDGLYADAAEASTRAAQAASAGGRDRQATTTVKARAQQTLGRTHTEKAAGLRSHAALLSGVGQSGVGGTQHASQAQAAASSAQDAHTQATAAFQDAIQTLESAGNNTEVAMLRQLLNRAATGQPVDLTPSMSGANTTSGGAGGDFTPEATLAFLQDIDSQNLGQVVTAMNIYHATTPGDQKLLDATRSLMATFQEFDRALKSRFGTGLMETANSQLSGMSNIASFSNATITQQRPAEADFTYTNAMGQSATGTLVQVNNTWYVDFGAMIKGTPGYDASQDAIMLQMFEAMTWVAQAVLDRISAGEFSSAQEAMAAFGQQMGLGSGG